MTPQEREFPLAAVVETAISREAVPVPLNRRPAQLVHERFARAIAPLRLTVRSFPTDDGTYLIVWVVPRYE